MKQGVSSARRAFKAMKRAHELPSIPLLLYLLEYDDDLLHAWYSSKVAGSRLTWEEFLEIAKEELDEVV